MIRDFFALCAMEGYVVEQWLAVDDKGLRSPLKRSPWLANLFGEQGLFLLRRSGPDSGAPKPFNLKRLQRVLAARA